MHLHFRKQLPRNSLKVLNSVTGLFNKHNPTINGPETRRMKALLLCNRLVTYVATTVSDTVTTGCKVALLHQ